MASDGSEETLFLRRLLDELGSIEVLSRWIIDPKRQVIYSDLLEDAFSKATPFRGLLIVVSDSRTRPVPHRYGKSGDLYLAAGITAIVLNSEGLSDALPTRHAGDLVSEGPSISIVDGALQNTFDDCSLGGLVRSTTLSESMRTPLESIEGAPDNAVGRSWILTAVMEVDR